MVCLRRCGVAVTAPVRFAALFWVFAACAGCQSEEDRRDARLMAECKTATCITVEDNDPTRALGVASTTRMAGSLRESWLDFGKGPHQVRFCSLVARVGGSAAGLAVEMGVDPGDLIVLDDGVAKVQRCFDKLDLADHTSHSSAVLLLNPREYTWFAPTKGHLFIPLHGSASLDGLLAIPVPPDRSYELGPLLDSVAIDIQPAGATAVPPPHVPSYPGLRPGDTFVWGMHSAEVVRILNRAGPLIGWVEVVLR